MTMMALTRTRHRALHLWALAIGLVLVAILGLGIRGQQASAIAEGDVQFSVTQTPAGGSTVQVGSIVRFDVSATVTAAPVGIPLYFEFDYPAGLALQTWGSTPPGVGCQDSTPSPGVVRCSYGLVLPGPRVPVFLEFAVNATVTTAPSQAMIRGGDSDGAPDTAADGTDDSFATAGVLTVFSSSTIAAAGSGSPSTVFEGSSTTYTTTLQNNSGVSTGSFSSAVSFNNGIVTGVTCTTSGVNGFANGGGSPSATCTGSNLANGEALTITATVAATNTSDGADITANISAPGLGVSQPGASVAVEELGLDFTGSTLVAGTPINLCSGLVPADIANDSAAGAAQPNSSALIGQVSLSPLLTTADFQVAGPGVGAVTAATGCAANQSGARFTPSAPGAYSVTALYNTGGTNVLALNVSGGPANNPVPSASLLSPSSANAGSGGFTLTVNGSNFVAASEVRWNGTARSTTFVSANTLEAAILGSDIPSAGSALVTVFNPVPGGGLSNSLTFTISAAPNPIPTIGGLSPNTVGAGVAQFVITVTGTNFVAGSVVRWDGVSLATVYGSPTSLTATVPAANVATAGAANVTVFNPSPGGGTTVTPQTFTISPGATKLAFTTQPGAGVAGTALAAQPVVAVQTAANATVTGDSTTVVTLVLTGTGTLTCTGGLTKTAAAGVASFAGCAVSVAGTGFTITASATALTSATSATFDVSAAPPTSSTQVTVTNPSNVAIPRSRLSFAISTGNLSGTAVGFIIKRKSDNKYWNETDGAWQTDLVLNAGEHGAGSTWTLGIEGEKRRDFAGTTVTLEVRVTVGTTVYVNAAIPELNIR